MDNNQSVPPLKRSRLSDNINVIKTSEPNVQSIVDAVNTSWRNEYNRMFQEKVVLEINYNDLVRKYNDLEIGHADLVKSHHDLFILYDSQCKHISELPTQTEVTRLNERIVEMEAVNQRNLKKIADLEKKEAATKHALESEKEKCAGLYKIIHELKASNKDRGQIIEQTKNQHQVINVETTDLEQRNIEAQRYGLVNENLPSKASIIEPKKKRKNRRGKRRYNKKQKEASDANIVEPQKKQVAVRNDLNEESITELVLQDQNLTWEEYVKHVSTESIKSLHFDRVRVEKPNGNIAYLEEIMEKVPNIQIFGCGFDKTESIGLDKGTFSFLLRLEPFKDLQKFNLYGVTLQKFDADSFLKFMKKHPNTEFMLSINLTVVKKVNAIAKMLREACPSKSKLVIELLRPDLSIIYV